MTRLHADPVEVRLRPTPDGPVPEQFLWHDRLYLVQAVLSSWTEAGQWWRGSGLRELTTGDAGAPASVIDDRTRTWWRVEAGRGRIAAAGSPTGVFDLCFDESRSAWALARVID